MNVRMFNGDLDYDDVVGWWSKQSWPVLPKQALSPSGFIAEVNGTKLAATWIFSTNCPIYIMEWTVGNPDVDYNIRNEALIKVTDAACDWAKKDGAVQVFTMTKHKR